MPRRFIFLVVALLFCLTSCTKGDKIGMEISIGSPMASVIEAQGQPSAVDTITCWVIGNANRIEFSGGRVYDFYLNPEDSMIQALTSRDRENRKARRNPSQSLLNTRLLMAQEDLSFLRDEVDSIAHYFYYNYGENQRLKVEDGLITSVDKGMKDDLLVLDKIRLNLGAGSMRVINITIAFVMFGIALNMRLDGFKELLTRPRSLIAGVIAQFVLLPALTFLLILWIKPPPSVALGMVLVAACPGGNISNFISTLAKGHIELSVALTAVATLLAVVMTPFNFAFWGGLYASASGLVVPISIDWWEMTKIVITLLGLPIFLGMTVRHFVPKVADKVEKPMRYFSIIFFLAIVVGAILQNFMYFKLYVGLIMGIVLVHNLLAFFTGYSFATIMRVRPIERRSITVETGIQNSGLALVLIVNPHLFDGLGGMAFIAAFWGIWHIVSGMMVAGVWRFIKDKEAKPIVR